MPVLTALLHTNNDALRLGRCLETLHPCDEILVIDHGSQDETVRIAREHGARVIAALPNVSNDHYAQLAAPGWILTLDPRESLTEGLAASLFELHEKWKSGGDIMAPVYSMFIRIETVDGWSEILSPETRLVPHIWKRWAGHFPAHEPSAPALEGALLRFSFP